MTLERRTQLRRKTPLKPGGPIKRKPSLSSSKRTTPATNKEIVKINDAIFSRIIRAPGQCAARGWRPTQFALDREWSVEQAEHEEEIYTAKCLGSQGLQCAHIISRSYFGVRWDARNAVPLCAACHTYFTYHPLEWQIWVEQHVGLKTYFTIRTIAYEYAAGRVPKLDYKEICAQLNAEALRLGLSLKGIAQPRR